MLLAMLGVSGCGGTGSVAGKLVTQKQLVDQHEGTKRRAVLPLFMEIIGG
jgi:hypothetical protein